MVSEEPEKKGASVELPKGSEQCVCMALVLLFGMNLGFVAMGKRSPRARLAPRDAVWASGLWWWLSHWYQLQDSGLTIYILKYLRCC